MQSPLDINKYFINPFLDPQISFNELVSYTSRHLARLVANNPGALLNGRITATTVAFTALDTCMLDNEVKLALRMARVQAKEAFRAVLPGHLGKVHGALVAAFGEPSPALTECFPQGRSPFASCPDDQLDDKLEQLLQCLTPLAPPVAAIHVANVGGLLSTWIALAAAVDTAESAKNTVENTRRNCRAALQLELFKNVLTLALAFPNDLAKAEMYCPQHLLEEPASGPLPAAAVFSLAESPAAGAAHLRFAAAGATSYRLEHKGPGEPAFTPVATVVEPGEYAATGLAAGAHVYRVQGRNAHGEGPASAEATVAVAALAAA